MSRILNKSKSVDHLEILSINLAAANNAVAQCIRSRGDGINDMDNKLACLKLSIDQYFS